MSQRLRFRSNCHCGNSFVSVIEVISWRSNKAATWIALYESGIKGSAARSFDDASTAVKWIESKRRDWRAAAAPRALPEAKRTGLPPRGMRRPRPFRVCTPTQTAADRRAKAARPRTDECEDSQAARAR